MRYHATVRTAGDLLEALDGVDPTTPILWGCCHDFTLDDGQCDGTVEARPSTVFITVSRPTTSDFDADLLEDGV
jgi:hypothetical protein